MRSSEAWLRGRCEAPIEPSIPICRRKARLLDYAGVKFLYAVEMADIYARLDSASTKAISPFWLARQERRMLDYCR
jgi:hypothetical protein